MLPGKKSVLRSTPKTHPAPGAISIVRLQIAANVPREVQRHSIGGLVIPAKMGPRSKGTTSTSLSKSE